MSKDISNTVVNSTHTLNSNSELLQSNKQIIKDVVTELRKAIDQLDENFARAKNLILELARVLDESKQCEQSQICRRIKEMLKDKIGEGKITAKWIEECLPQEYKRKYTKSELTSLSENANKPATKTAVNNKGEAIEDAEEDIIPTLQKCKSENLRPPENDNHVCARCLELEAALLKASPITPAKYISNRDDEDACISDNNIYNKLQNSDNLLSFEFAFRSDEILNYLFFKSSDKDVWFNGTIDKNTGKVITTSIGRISQYSSGAKEIEQSHE